MAAILPLHLPDHLHTLFISAVSFAAVHHLVAPEFARFLVGTKTWNALRPRDRVGWQSHVSSLVHSLVILPLTARCLHLPALAADRVFGWDPRVGTLFAITSGYFLWDSIVCLVHFEGVGFLIHGWACLTIYLNAFRPFLAYYGPRFILWELSTPFLNIHWMLDKTGQTGSPLQLVNGLILLSTFGGARLVYGSIMSYQFYQSLFNVRDGLSSAVFAGYISGNVILNGLNVFWFSRMIAAIRKRFHSTNTKDAKPRQASSQPQHANVVDRHRDNAASGGDRRLTMRGEAARQQHLS
ncbi:TLC domain-containing protein [Russula compacta]|nr:TLC domain-containing protein [Russula compacta]